MDDTRRRCKQFAYSNLHTGTLPIHTRCIAIAVRCYAVERYNGKQQPRCSGRSLQLPLWFHLFWSFIFHAHMALTRYQVQLFYKVSIFLLTPLGLQRGKLTTKKMTTTASGTAWLGRVKLVSRLQSNKSYVRLGPLQHR